MKSGIIYPQVISYPMTWIADTQIFPLYFRSINQNADLARGKHLKNLSKFYSRYGPNSSMCQGWLWTSVEWSQLATAGTLGTSWKYSQFHLQDEVRGVHKWRNTFFDQKGNHQFKYGVLNGCSNYSDSVFSGETILQTLSKYGTSSSIQAPAEVEKWPVSFWTEIGFWFIEGH